MAKRKNKRSCDISQSRSTEYQPRSIIPKSKEKPTRRLCRKIGQIRRLPSVHAGKQPHVRNSGTWGSSRKWTTDNSQDDAAATHEFISPRSGRRLAKLLIRKAMMPQGALGSVTPFLEFLVAFVSEESVPALVPLPLPRRCRTSLQCVNLHAYRLLCNNLQQLCSHSLDFLLSFFHSLSRLPAQFTLIFTGCTTPSDHLREKKAVSSAPTRRAFFGATGPRCVPKCW